MNPACESDSDNEAPLGLAKIQRRNPAAVVHQQRAIAETLRKDATIESLSVVGGTRPYVIGENSWHQYPKSSNFTLTMTNVTKYCCQTSCAQDF